MSQEISYRKLRVLLVDDNHINLSVLSTLLKRRFSNLLDGQPVVVDSGLKAIQLLRTNVFDCVLMDIQMPFLSGLDTSIRIRNGEDGVLEANRNAHIVAVTTAVGDEPELAYRRAGMDGMIGKPVRFQDMQHYICPLAHEAFNAAPSVDTISVEGQTVMPPLPPIDAKAKRLFYLPANATIRAPQPDICMGADFERMLRAQTRASLRKDGAIAIAGTGTWTSFTSTRRQQDGDVIEENTSKSPTLRKVQQQELNSFTESESETASDLHKDGRGRSTDQMDSRLKHSRNASLTINKRTLSQQIQREMENMEGHVSDFSDSGTVKLAPRKVHPRPSVIHRTSSPAWLVTEAPSDETDVLVESPIASSPNTALHFSPERLDPSNVVDWQSFVKGRPKIFHQGRISSSSSNSSGRLSSPFNGSDIDEHVAPSMTSDSTGWISRRASGRSTGSCSEESLDLATPANEVPTWPNSSLFAPLEGKSDVIRQSIHPLAQAGSSSTIDPLSSDGDGEDLLEELKPSLDNGKGKEVTNEDARLTKGIQNLTLTTT